MALYGMLSAFMVGGDMWIVERASQTKVACAACGGGAVTLGATGLPQAGGRIITLPSVRTHGVPRPADAVGAPPRVVAGPCTDHCMPESMNVLAPRIGQTAEMCCTVCYSVVHSLGNKPC